MVEKVAVLEKWSMFREEVDVRNKEQFPGSGGACL